MPYFVQEVLPRMERAGLRQPFSPARATPSIAAQAVAV